MDIFIEEIDGVALAKPQAERLDAAVAPAFKGKMVDLVNAGQTRVVLDLSLVEFMDSSGLGAMLSSLKTITSCGGKLAVVGVAGHLANLFKLTKLEKIVPVYESAEQARQAMA